MKKWVFILLLSTVGVQAQQDSAAVRKNELRIDLLSLIASSKLNLSYERFLNRSFSVGLTGSYADSKSVNEDFDSGYRSTLPKLEVIPYVRYNLSKGKAGYYFAEAFASANSGDYRETVRLTDTNGNGYYTVKKDSYFDVALGGGLGYKMYFGEKIAAELLVGFGSNLIDKSKSPDVISRVGLSVGYRF
ncbi:MAG TPA: DUF3575 domain-containing protein [Flavobacterium sp.]|jgi:hypothetical protein|nr:DUF3575 domain-containing protein [Flavobacterium sp.]